MSQVFFKLLTKNDVSSLLRIIATEFDKYNIEIKYEKNYIKILNRSDDSLIRKIIISPDYASPLIAEDSIEKILYLPESFSKDDLDKYLPSLLHGFRRDSFKKTKVNNVSISLENELKAKLAILLNHNKFKSKNHELEILTDSFLGLEERVLFGRNGQLNSRFIPFILMKLEKQLENGKSILIEFDDDVDIDIPEKVLTLMFPLRKITVQSHFALDPNGQSLPNDAIVLKKRNERMNWMAKEHDIYIMMASQNKIEFYYSFILNLINESFSNVTKKRKIILIGSENFKGKSSFENFKILISKVMIIGSEFDTSHFFMSRFGIMPDSRLDDFYDVLNRFLIRPTKKNLQLLKKFYLSSYYHQLFDTFPSVKSDLDDEINDLDESILHDTAHSIRKLLHLKLSKKFIKKSTLAKLQSSNANKEDVLYASLEQNVISQLEEMQYLLRSYPHIESDFYDKHYQNLYDQFKRVKDPILEIFKGQKNMRLNDQYKISELFKTIEFRSTIYSINYEKYLDWDRHYSVKVFNDYRKQMILLLSFLGEESQSVDAILNHPQWGRRFQLVLYSPYMFGELYRMSPKNASRLIPYMQVKS